MRTGIDPLRSPPALACSSLAAFALLVLGITVPHIRQLPPSSAPIRGSKAYKEFDAENTFEGESFDIAVTAKF
jgi:hypothetical protein